MPSMSWSVYSLWNQSLEVGNDRDRTPQKRDRIWASELGGSMIDRYLKMSGVPPSNPFDERSLRKFEAGHLWEWIVGLVLKRAGILLQGQGWVQYSYQGLLPVSGKLDYLAGGKPDWTAASSAVEELRTLDIPEFIVRAAQSIVEQFSSKYPDGMKEVVLEIKSASSYSFERKFESQKPDPQHVLQAFHYLKATGRDEAHIVYICKDDCRMLEVGIMNPSPIEEAYREDIRVMTSYWNAKREPPHEPEVVFMEDTGRFAANWKVGYSPYLTKLYGYATQAEFDDKYKNQLNRWNRVFKKAMKDEKITKDNREVIAEINRLYPFDVLVSHMKERK